jgi:hypothetical protein
MEIEERVRKSLALFDANIKKLDNVDLTDSESKVIELARMYASDTRSWIEKGDMVTAFSAIEYAHGLLDAIIKTKAGG